MSILHVQAFNWKTSRSGGASWNSSSSGWGRDIGSHVVQGKSGKRKTAMLQEIGKGGLVVGTRLALSLCDDCNVGLIGWIDADAETWRPNYNARFMASA